MNHPTLYKQYDKTESVPNKKVFIFIPCLSFCLAKGMRIWENKQEKGYFFKGFSQKFEYIFSSFPMGRRKDIDLISGFFLGMHRVSVAAYHQPYHTSTHTTCLQAPRYLCKY